MDKVLGELHNRCELRRLWHEHVQWTREAIITAIWLIRAGKPAFENEKAFKAVSTRLLQNQTDISQKLIPKNPRRANQLRDLLRAHIIGAVDILKLVRDMAVSGKDVSMNTAQKIIGTEPITFLRTGIREIDAWYDNGREISLFLNIFPKDPIVIQHAFNTHLHQTLEEAFLYLNENYEQSVRVYDKGQTHMQIFSDAIYAYHQQ